MARIHIADDSSSYTHTHTHTAVVERRERAHFLDVLVVHFFFLPVAASFWSAHPLLILYDALSHCRLLEQISSPTRRVWVERYSHVAHPPGANQTTTRQTHKRQIDTKRSIRLYESAQEMTTMHAEQQPQEQTYSGDDRYEDWDVRGAARSLAYVNTCVVLCWYECATDWMCRV